MQITSPRTVQNVIRAHNTRENFARNWLTTLWSQCKQQQYQ